MLPKVFASQFYHDSESEELVVKGELEDIWYKPRFLFPLFWLLEKCGILIAERRNNVSTTLKVTAVSSKDFGMCQVWRRRFMADRTKKFDVRVVYDSKTKRAVDLVGPFEVLALGWDLSSQGDTFCIDVATAGIRVGTRFLWMPSFLWPYLLGRETFRQTVVDEAEGRFSIQLHIEHPVFGPIFGYSGNFVVEQDAALKSDPRAG